MIPPHIRPRPPHVVLAAEKGVLLIFPPAPAPDIFCDFCWIPWSRGIPHAPSCPVAAADKKAPVLARTADEILRCRSCGKWSKRMPMDASIPHGNPWITRHVCDTCLPDVSTGKNEKEAPGT